MAKDREKEPKINESKIKKVEFLKVIASNPDKKAAQIGQQDFAMSSSAVYNAINEFVLNCIWSDEDADYPTRVLNYYNKDILNEDEKLNATDVQMLRHYVDDYYSHHLPGGDLREGKQAVHVDNIQVPAEVIANRQEYPSPNQNYNNPPQEHYTSNRMSDSQPRQPYQPPFNQEQWRKNDLSTDAGYLKTLLEQGKYVHPTLIERFVRQYDMNKEVFDRDPIALLGYMKHMFTAQQGEELWKLFQKGRGKFVPDNPNQMGQGGMDPMQMMLMMNMMGGGGGFNPSMMPFLQQMGGQNYGGNGMDMNQMMMMLMMQQMGQKSQKDQQKQDMNEMFEKMIQAIMLKMVSGASEDKKPWDVYGMMGMNPMMGPPQIQEVMDANGRVTQRNIVPSFGMGGHSNQPDPLLMSVLNNTMNTNTQLLMKITDAGKTPTDILLGMIPYFKDSGNSALQLSNMFKTMNEMVPGFFNKGNQEAPNVEIAKLKLDTDLALQAQRMELAKMEHTWRIDEMDRKANNDNAQNWMRMIETLGGSFTDKVAPALLEGFGKGGLMGGKGPGAGGPGQQMDPMAAQMRMQNMRMKQMQEQEREARMTEAQREQQREQQKQVQQMQEQQQMSQQQAMFAIAQLQSAVQQRDKYIQDLTRQMQDIQNQPTQRYAGGPQQVNEQQLLRLQTGELQQMLREINNQSSQESALKSRIETILANRSIMDQQAPVIRPEDHEPAVAQPVDEPGTETEDLSSNDTRDFEEHLPE